MYTELSGIIFFEVFNHLVLQLFAGVVPGVNDLSQTLNLGNFATGIALFGHPNILLGSGQHGASSAAVPAGLLR
jgi:hypothetical protein